MTLTVTIHDATKLTAESASGSSAEWVDIEITSSRGDRNTICIFFAKPGKAEQFAARFNYAAADAHAYGA